jgi:hypothetical protein
MDLFTHHSDLDLSINFSDSTDDQYTHKKKIYALRKFAKVLYSHQSKYRHAFKFFNYPFLTWWIDLLHNLWVTYI